MAPIGRRTHASVSAGIELLAVAQSSRVVHGHGITFPDLDASAEVTGLEFVALLSNLLQHRTVRFNNCRVNL